jgi:hypothetical protein
MIAIIHTRCYADCNCDDWMKRGGYCIDYVKARIPTFPMPYTNVAIAALKNRGIAEVQEGDVAIFDLGKLWHVSYVEKVHKDQHGKATAIDVSEMNHGGQLSFPEYHDKWRSQNVREWKRAICCGVTNTYGEMTLRNNIPLHTVKQIWSPNASASEVVR